MKQAFLWGKCPKPGMEMQHSWLLFTANHFPFNYNGEVISILLIQKHSQNTHYEREVWEVREVRCRRPTDDAILMQKSLIANNQNIGYRFWQILPLPPIFRWQPTRETPANSIIWPMYQRQRGLNQHWLCRRCSGVVQFFQSSINTPHGQKVCCVAQTRLKRVEETRPIHQVGGEGGVEGQEPINRPPAG